MRATNLKNLLSVSVFIPAIVYMSTPVWADVDIIANLTGEPNEVIISFDATSETNLVRAFALDVRFGNDVNIIDVTGISSDFYIYPGTIQIDAQGNVMDFGTPAAEYSDLPSGTLPGFDSNSITIEMASLYAPVGPGSPNAPARSGDLVSIKVSGIFCDTVITPCEICAAVSEYCCVTISGNVARAGGTGIVMEDPNEVVEVNFHNICYSQPPPPPCLRDTDPGYETWQLFGEPNCWCYRHQCQGDADGFATFGRYVALSDLNILKSGFGKTVTELAGVPNGLCADFDHQTTFGRPVALSDLNILKANFGVMGLPDCPMTHLDHYENP